MLNPALGIEQLGGNRTLYLNLLKLFLAQLAQDFASLPSLLLRLTPSDHGQWQQAQFLNHTLKGVAANLAATDLTEISTEIDLALKRHESLTNVQIHQFQRVFNDTQTAIGRYLSIHETITANTISENSNMILSLQDILSRIQNNELIDDETLSQLSLQIPTQFNDHWQTACDALNEFNFDQAAEAIKQLLDHNN
jgi:HPt (histidine-containing phosphotransfer) domain-containing protein